ncbi:MAG: hypothetical protein KGL53_13940, partial [Elusimicrobia bacterium]|nr:hypothetical protein [Elusimicrobiota bacterium]
EVAAASDPEPAPRSPFEEALSEPPPYGGAPAQPPPFEYAPLEPLPEPAALPWTPPAAPAPAPFSSPAPFVPSGPQVAGRSLVPDVRPARWWAIDGPEQAAIDRWGLSVEGGGDLELGEWLAAHAAELEGVDVELLRRKLARAA